MKSDKWVVTDGSTVEEAIEAALALLKASRDEVEIVVEEEPRDGLLGLWRWRARVRARRKAEQSDDAGATAKSEAAQETEPIVGTAPADGARKAALEADAEAAPEEAKSPPRVQAAISMRDGKVDIVAPEGWSEPFLVYPDEHAQVWVNGQLVEGPYPAGVGDVVQVEAISEPPETVIDVYISGDEYTASISVFMNPGRRRTLMDAPPGPQLRVQTRSDGLIPPKVPTVDELRQALHDNGVVYGISPDALQRLVEQLEENPAAARTPVPVAFGVPVQPTVDEQIELLFDTAERVQVTCDDHRADLLGVFQLSSVGPGEVLAVKRPGQKGKPGRTVTDKTVPVTEPKEAVVAVGDGAAWSEDGQQIVSTRGGRPMKSRQTIFVHPHHTVAGDAEAATGHIEFDGDVTITGGVGESMRVVSKGSVSVGQSVAYASVEAEEAVVIGRGIVQSTVVAGARSSHLFRLAAYFQPLADDLGGLIEEAEALSVEPGSDKASQPIGTLVKRLLDERFVRVARRVERLQELVERGLGRGPHGDVSPCVQDLHKFLVGLGPLSLNDLQPLVRLHREVVGYVELFEEQQTSAVDVVAAFVDNSEVLAAGRIVLRRGGSYSRLWAGTGIDMEAGVFRGTSLTVHRGDVRVKEIGSRSGAPVEVEIVTEGTFRAGAVHQGVAVAVGNRRRVFRRPARDVRVRLVDGELEVHVGIEGP